MTWRNTLKLAKGAENPSVDLVNAIKAVALKDGEGQNFPTGWRR